MFRESWRWMLPGKFGKITIVVIKMEKTKQGKKINVKKKEKPTTMNNLVDKT